MRLIDAEALKVQIHSRCDVCNDKDTAWCEHCCSVNDWEDYIDNAPTIEERPKGKWELFEKRPCQNLYMCSNCGHIIESMPDRLVENFKGCYCGADMRGDV